MSDDFDYTNPRRGTSGRFIRREFGDPETGQGSFELDIVGKGSAGWGGSEVSEVFEFPESSRCIAARYHYRDRKLLMTWCNGRTPWVYHDVPRDTFDRFVGSQSKGQYVNQILNSFSHGKVYQGDPYSEHIYTSMPLQGANCKEKYKSRRR